MDIRKKTKSLAMTTFLKGNVYKKMRDKLGSIYKDVLLIGLYSDEGQSGHNCH